ncbi:MAG: hypothetical protein ABFC73_14965, partial [Clostridiaceae bacterium]
EPQGNAFSAPDNGNTPHKLCQRRVGIRPFLPEFRSFRPNSRFPSRKIHRFRPQHDELQRLSIFCEKKNHIVFKIQALQG